MVLDPLTKVCVRVLMPVSVRRRQFVMDILRDGERGKRKQDRDDPQDASGPQQGEKRSFCQSESHEYYDIVTETKPSHPSRNPIRNKPFQARLSTGLDFRRAIR